MKSAQRSALLCLIFLAGDAALAQEATAVWSQLSQPTLAANKSTNVSNLLLARDRIRITLAEGVIHFLEPSGGVVYGAEFHGRGRVQVQLPNALEVQQLRLFVEQDTLDLEFSDAVFVFSDATYQEIARQVQWASFSGAGPAPLYISRQQEREDVGAELLPRLFKSVLSTDRMRTGLFVADLKTAEKGWVQLRFDALEPEEISVGRWVEWIRTTQFETWLSFPAGDRGPSEAYRDPMSREDFLIRGYRIDASVSEAEELRAATQLLLEYRATGERVLVFELDSNLRLESVKTEQGALLPFFQPRDPKDREQSYGDYVAVVLPEATRAGTRETLEFRYAGKRVVRKVGQDNYFCQSYGWYPTRPTSFATRADFEMTFRSPKKYTLVATGSKVSETVDGDIVVTTWKSDLPLAVAGFAFGDYKVHHDKAGAVDVEIYANYRPDDFMAGLRLFLDNPFPDRPDIRVYGAPPVGTLSPAALVKTMGIELANTVRLFEKYYGPYPYKRLALTNIPYSYGQGWPGLIYLSALSFLDKTQLHALGLSRYNREITDFFRAHEASHQWWGHRVGWKSYHDQWISEGFAQFSGNLYVHFRQGDEKEYLNRLRRDKEELFERDKRNRRYESLGPVWMGRRLSTFDSPLAYQTVIYNKGGYILHMLRMMLFDSNNPNPDTRFIAMMHDFTKTFDNKPASTEDFKAIVEKHMTPAMDVEGNRRLDWFFRQYVYGTGMPRYEFRYTVQPAEGSKSKVTATITQSGVPEGWKDVLPIYVHASGKVVLLGWTRATRKESKLEFTLPFNPQKLSLNYYEDIFAEIKQ